MGSVEGGVNLRSPGNCNSFLKGNGGEQFGGHVLSNCEGKTNPKRKKVNSFCFIVLMDKILPHLGRT